jgi:hypothetical protein
MSESGTETPHPIPLPIGWGEGVRRTGEGFVREGSHRISLILKVNSNHHGGHAKHLRAQPRSVCEPGHGADETRVIAPHPQQFSLWRSADLQSA